MTQILGTLVDAGGSPITGKLLVSLPGSMVEVSTTPDTIYLPYSANFTITAGVVNINLQESETKKITYNFQFFKTDTGGGLIEPALLNFNALVPNLSPVQFASLLPTGIVNDVIDTGAIRVANIIANTPTLAQSIGGPFPRGEYSPLITYKYRDLVSYLGRTYISKDSSPIQNITPTITASWQYIPIEATGSLILGDATPYASTWNGSGLAASQNSIYDEIESIKTTVSTKANLISPIFSGDVIVPDKVLGSNDTNAANTSFVASGLALKANLTSPTLTGTPTAPTASSTTSNTQIATTAFAQSLCRPAVNVSAASAATQTAAFYVVSFSSESLDTNNAFSGTTFTTPITGYYFVSGGIALANTDSVTRQFNATIYLNGSPYRQVGSVILTAGQGNYITLAGILIPLTIGNTLTVRIDVFGGASTPFTVYAGGTTHLSLFRLPI
jgi:hypothetical protein